VVRRSAHYGRSIIRRIGFQAYEELCDRIEGVVKEATPAGAVIAVVSKGDPRLLEIDGRSGLHFPADSEGGYAGYYPRTSEEAIAQVEAARRSGAEYLCLPASALWWLEHYQTLASWLGVHCRVAAREGPTCILYDLLRSPAEKVVDEQSGSGQQLSSLLDSLLPDGALLFVTGFEIEHLAAPGRTVSPLQRGNPLQLRRRLESRPDRPTFLLLALGRPSGSADPSAIELMLDNVTDLIARRSGLCELRQVNAARKRSRPPRSRLPGDGASAAVTQMGGERADELSRRLERLGLQGQDDSLPLQSGEVLE
jgi:hypothetical protein